MSRFGAPRSGHTHQGQDVGASCGTKLVAVRRAKVRYRAYEGAAGNYVVLHNIGTHTDFVYMHLIKPAAVRPGRCSSARARRSDTSVRPATPPAATSISSTGWASGTEAGIRSTRCPTCARSTPRAEDRSAGGIGNDGRPMHVTAKADYAVRAAVELAAAPPGPMTGEAISSAQQIPLPFLEKILAELRQAGIVRSQRGVGGGSELARPAEEITLGEVIRAVDGPLASVRSEPPEELSYAGSAVPLRDVWLALRVNVRRGARCGHARRRRRRQAARPGHGPAATGETGGGEGGAPPGKERPAPSPLQTAAATSASSSVEASRAAVPLKTLACLGRT